jgi:tetratricopeptide (TPR) repeat protein
MKSIATILVLSAFVGMIAPAFSANSDDAMSKAILAHSLHQYQEAEQLYQDALSQAESNGKIDSQILALKGLGSLSMNLGKNEDAVKSYRKAMVLENAQDNVSDEVRTNTLISLATAYRNLDKFSEAEPLYTKALNLAKTSHNKENESIALDHLSTLCRYDGRLGEADTYSKQAVSAAESQWGSNNMNTALAKANRGKLLALQGRYREAEAILGSALAVGSKITNGGNDLNVASIESDLALVFLTQGKLEQAKSHYTKGIEMRSKLAGRTDVGVADMESNLARAYLEGGNLSKAAEISEHALSIAEAKFGTKSPNLFNDLIVLGSVYNAKGNTSKALELAQRALEMGRSYKALLLMAQVHRARGDMSSAQKFAREAVTTCEQRLGPEHPQVAKCLVELATCVRRSNPAEAVALEKRSKSIQDRITTLNNL